MGDYPNNPWWWWGAAAWGTAAAFVDVVTPDPYYVDYGMTVVYEDETVYVDNQPVPVEQYTEPIIDLAVSVEQPPPPLPPQSASAPAAPAAAGVSDPGYKKTAPAAAPAPAEEWLPLGVFALAQEEKGDPVMFFQISVNREGVLSGGYESTISDDQRPIAGQVDKSTQKAAWRIGDNTSTIFESSLANLTQDVSPIAIHFGNAPTQT